MRRLSYILLFSLIAFKQKACGVCREISRHIFLYKNIDSIKNLIARELWRNVLIDEAMRENSVTN